MVDCLTCPTCTIKHLFIIYYGFFIVSLMLCTGNGASRYLPFHKYCQTSFACLLLLVGERVTMIPGGGAGLPQNIKHEDKCGKKGAAKAP